MCDVYREMSDWDATLYNIIRNIILNKNKTKTKKNKKTKNILCWLRAKGPESTNKMCDVYREMNDWDVARS